MSEKRKDHKGRILKTGESQRKDSTYQYRYTDIGGKRRTVYAPDLTGLREKEKEIQKQLDQGIDYAAGNITVIQLAERYIEVKRGVRKSTRDNYRYVLSIIKKYDFGYRPIKNVKPLDAKQWVIKLNKDGQGYGSINNIRGMLRPAFQMAYDEDMIYRNPFDFKLSDVVPNDSKARVALTKEQQVSFMNFVRSDNVYKKYYDEFVVLLGTGLRVSEMCGLTKADLDFQKRKIRVERQLIQGKGKAYIEKPKSKHGYRFIPMTDEVYQSLKRIVESRDKMKMEPIVDGVSGFILLNRNGIPKTSDKIQISVNHAVRKYKKMNPNDSSIQITPHVMRHTFCTNMANAGMDVKSLQYIMGHSDVAITLNVYTHANYEHVAEQMGSLVDFQTARKEERQEKSS